MTLTFPTNSLLNRQFYNTVAANIVQNVETRKVASYQFYCSSYCLRCNVALKEPHSIDQRIVPDDEIIQTNCDNCGKPKSTTNSLHVLVNFELGQCHYLQLDREKALSKQDNLWPLIEYDIFAHKILQPRYFDIGNNSHQYNDVNDVEEQ